MLRFVRIEYKDGKASTDRGSGTKKSDRKRKIDSENSKKRRYEKYEKEHPGVPMVDRRTAEGKRAFLEYEQSLCNAKKQSRTSSLVTCPSSSEIESTPSTQILHDAPEGAIYFDQSYEAQPSPPPHDTPCSSLNDPIQHPHARPDSLESALPCDPPHSDQLFCGPEETANSMSQSSSSATYNSPTIAQNTPQLSTPHLPPTLSELSSENLLLTTHTSPLPATPIELPARLFRKTQPPTSNLPPITPISPVQSSRHADIRNVPPRQPITYTFESWTSDSMLLIPPPMAESPIQEPVYQISASFGTARFLPNCYVTQVRRVNRDIVGQFELSLNHRWGTLTMGDVSMRISNVVSSIGNNPRHLNWDFHNTHLRWDCRTTREDGTLMCICYARDAAMTPLASFLPPSIDASPALSAPTLRVFPDGHQDDLLDHIVLSALIIERNLTLAF